MLTGASAIASRPGGGQEATPSDSAAPAPMPARAAWRRPDPRRGGPETFFHRVDERCSSAAGSGRVRSILVHGGSSGIGTTAIQLARVLGARVFATAGSAEQCAACEALRRERAFNYRETDFVAAV